MCTLTPLPRSRTVNRMPAVNQTANYCTNTAVVFRLARNYCGMSLKEIGIAAGGVDYAAVSDRVRRHEKAGDVSEMERHMCSILNLETCSVLTRGIRPRFYLLSFLDRRGERSRSSASD